MTYDTHTAREHDLSPRRALPELRLTGSIVGLALAAAELVTVAFEVGLPWQPALTFAFVFACPGLVLLDLLELPDSAGKLMIVAGASISCNVLVASTLLVAGVWSAPICIAVTGGLTGLTATPQAWRASGERRALADRAAVTEANR